MSKRTGKLKRNSVTKAYINKDMESWNKSQVIDKYNARVEVMKNTTVYTKHGMITHDKRYKGESGKIVSIIKHENKLSTDQAYYFLYVMQQSGMTYKQTKLQLLSSKEFEEYDKRKKGRISKQQLEKQQKRDNIARYRASKERHKVNKK
jgi:hypothetical protein